MAAWSFLVRKKDQVVVPIPSGDTPLTEHQKGQVRALLSEAIDPKYQAAQILMNQDALLRLLVQKKVITIKEFQKKQSEVENGSGD